MAFLADLKWRQQQLNKFSQFFSVFLRSTRYFTTAMQIKLALEFELLNLQRANAIYFFL